MLSQFINKLDTVKQTIFRGFLTGNRLSH